MCCLNGVLWSQCLKNHKTTLESFRRRSFPSHCRFSAFKTVLWRHESPSIRFPLRRKRKNRGHSVYKFNKNAYVDLCNNTAHAQSPSSDKSSTSKVHNVVPQKFTTQQNCTITLRKFLGLDWSSEEVPLPRKSGSLRLCVCAFHGTRNVRSVAAAVNAFRTCHALQRFQGCPSGNSGFAISRFFFGCPQTEGIHETRAETLHPHDRTVLNINCLKC